MLMNADMGASSSSGGVPGVRGAALLMRQHELFKTDPEQAWVKLEARVKAPMNWEAGDRWSLEDVVKQWPWGH
jgi:hypothetical protein